MSVYSARIRAARGYAGITQLELANALEVDEQTIKRRESPKGKNPKKGERIAIASICGVPPEFMEQGWDAIADNPRREDALSLLVQVLRDRGLEIPPLPGEAPSPEDDPDLEDEGGEADVA